MTIATGSIITRFSNSPITPPWAMMNWGAVPNASTIGTSSPTGAAWNFVSFGPVQSPTAQYLAQGQYPEYVPNTPYCLGVWFYIGPGATTLTDNLQLALQSTNNNSGGLVNGVAAQFNLAGLAANQSAPGPYFASLPYNFDTTSGAWTNNQAGVYFSGNWMLLWISGTTGNTPGLMMSIGLTTIATGPLTTLQPDAIASPGQGFIFGGANLTVGINPYLSATAPVTGTFQNTYGAPTSGVALQVFPFLFHDFSEQYPPNNLIVQFGGGYQFATPPLAPYQRIFDLKFEGMRWLFNADGSLDLFSTGMPADIPGSSTLGPSINMGALRAFYQDVQLYQQFLYAHPLDGFIKARFQKPLTIPPVYKNSPATVGPFTIHLIEVL